MIQKTASKKKTGISGPLGEQIVNQNDVSMVLEAFNLRGGIRGFLDKHALFVSQTRKEGIAWPPILQRPQQSRSGIAVDRGTVLGVAQAIASGVHVERSANAPSTLVSTVRNALLHQMSRVFGEASVQNWDGYGAQPASREAYKLATRFALLLPVTVADPEPSVDSDGDFSFEWYRGARRVFAVSVSADGSLNYAGLFERSSTHGTEILGDEIPAAIALGLARVIG